MGVEELDIPSDDAAIAAVRSMTTLFRENVGCNRNPLRLLQDRLLQLGQGGGDGGNSPGGDAGDGGAGGVSSDDSSIRKAGVYLKAVDSLLLNVHQVDWKSSKAREKCRNNASSSSAEA